MTHENEWKPPPNYVPPNGRRKVKAAERVQAAMNIGGKVTIRCTNLQEFADIQSALQEADSPMRVSARFEPEGNTQ
nr:hypothetical protein [uncultured Ruegeria sp.]